MTGLHTQAETHVPPGTPALFAERRRKSWIRRMPTLFWVGIGFLVLVVLMAIFAGVVAPHDPIQSQLALRLEPPFWLGGPSSWARIVCSSGTSPGARSAASSRQ